MAIDLTATQPDLIILDVRLPDSTGYEVCRRIKSNPETAGIPALQISASFVATEDRVRALEAGADGYLTHPIDDTVLVATVRALMRLHVAETAARKSAQQWEATFDALSEGLAILDSDDRLVRWNAAFATICGSEFVPEREEAPLPYFRRVAGTGWFGEGQERLTAEFQIESRTVLLSVNSIDADEERQERILILHDITDRKLAEYALRTAKKLAATVKLANAIAHEINNPLEAITNLVFLAKASNDLDFIQELLSKSSAELDRIARIAKQTLTFHRDTQHPVPINLGNLVSDVVVL